MLKCNGKTFMNLQEAVQWLLNNNALFFICNEDYAADTEISLEELVNPSPANPKIGSLVLFADGNIATIIGITDDSFIVGSDSINIRSQKAVTHFSIDASQHLIVHYSDGTSDNLGAIFSGDVDISGQLTATTAKIFEKIVDRHGHKRFIEGDIAMIPITGVTQTYGRWSLSGTHLMIALAFTVANGATLGTTALATINDIPAWVMSKIIPSGDTEKQVAVKYADEWVDNNYPQTQQLYCGIQKPDASSLQIARWGSSLTFSADTFFRLQFDLIIDNE